MKPIAQVVTSSATIPYPHIERLIDIGTIRAGTYLYTADQLRAVQVAVLREAITRLPGYNENHVILGRMANELEKSK